jgi:hypothetical protein
VTFLSLKYDVNVPSKSNKQRNLDFFVSLTKRAGSGAGSVRCLRTSGSGSVPKCHGSGTLERSMTSEEHHCAAGEEREQLTVKLSSEGRREPYSGEDSTVRFTRK